MAKFEQDDLICGNCINEKPLQEIVNAEGQEGTCVLCGQVCKSGVTIRRLAEIVDPIFREHFKHGPIYDGEQQGSDLSESLQTMLGDALEYDDDLYAAIIDALVDVENWHPKDGDDQFYEDSSSYEEKDPTAFGPTLEWDEISDELKTRRRFFSDRAKSFFDELLEDVEVLTGYPEGEDHGKYFIPKGPELKVVQTWPIKTPLYRARRAERVGETQKFLANPQVQLAPPPAGTARAGRMNPEGISVFYGALDEATCLAELRSSIGSTMVVGRFETTAVLRILDFRVLEKAWGYKPLSYFQHDFQSQLERYEFLRRLHRLISQPVVPGHDSEYLITQVLAEYLAHVRTPKFDGVVFASTQHQGGANVVIFSQTTAQFPVTYVIDSAAVYKTAGIEYTTKKLGFYKGKDGEIEIYGHYDDE